MSVEKKYGYQMNHSCLRIISNQIEDLLIF